MQQQVLRIPSEVDQNVEAEARFVGDEVRHGERLYLRRFRAQTMTPATTLAATGTSDYVGVAGNENGLPWASRRCVVASQGLEPRTKGL